MVGVGLQGMNHNETLQPESCMQTRFTTTYWNVGWSRGTGTLPLQARPHACTSYFTAFRTDVNIITITIIIINITIVVVTECFYIL